MQALRPPTRSFFSNKVTLKPRAAKIMAVVRPPGPAPMMLMCFGVFKREIDYSIHSNKANSILALI